MKNSLLFLLLILSACSYLPEEDVLINHPNVVETADYIAFESEENNQKSTGLLFYPGGLVAPQAYINTFENLAANGYTVLIVKVNGNLAVLNPNKGHQVKDDYGEIDRWVLAGHSLGGVMAAALADKHREEYPGLVLMASYPANGNDLRDWSGEVLSITADLDEVLDWAKWDSARDLLPDDTNYESIIGGNHSQFGNYGLQEGDQAATISKEAQYTAISELILNFFTSNGWD